LVLCGFWKGVAAEKGGEREEGEEEEEVVSGTEKEEKEKEVENRVDVLIRSFPSPFFPV
jgi:hypothetical protein